MNVHVIEQEAYKMVARYGGFLIATSDAESLRRFPKLNPPFFIFRDLKSAFDFACEVSVNSGLSRIARRIGLAISFGTSTVSSFHEYDGRKHRINYNGDGVNLAFRAMEIAYEHGSTWHMWIAGKENGGEGEIDAIRVMQIVSCA